MKINTRNRRFLILAAFLLLIVNASALVLWVLLSLNGRDLSAADVDGLVRHTFTLDQTRFELLLPADYALTSESDAQVRFTLPGQRVDRAIILDGTASPMRFAEGDRSVRLEGGYRLRYVVVPDLGAGSGGTVAEMVGQMQVGSVLLSVSCRDQDELAPDPAWCIPYLHHLRQK